MQSSSLYNYTSFEILKILGLYVDLFYEMKANGWNLSFIDYKNACRTLKTAISSVFSEEKEFLSNTLGKENIRNQLKDENL